LSVDGKDFRNNKYRSIDYFVFEGDRLRGKTRRARRLAERLNSLRRGAAA
jgi:hypothetical protein